MVRASSRRLALTGAALVLALVGVSGCGTKTATPAPTPTVDATTQTDRPPVIRTVDIGDPQQLTIDTIGVDAPIINVGTAADGSQDVPKTMHETGWWDLGSRPGEQGNAVIVGHKASKTSAVFDDLNTLKPGTIVTVKGSKGSAKFEVTRTFDHPVNDFADVADMVYRDSGTPGLVLMTCGDWNGAVFESTTIVTTNLVG